MYKINATTNHAMLHVGTFHTSIAAGDDILHKFWEVETPKNATSLSLEERVVVRHSDTYHSCTKEGLLSLERSLNHEGCFNEFEAIMREYLDVGHAKRVPLEDINKPEHEVFYLPVHVVYKSSSTTTKVKAVFDASAKVHVQKCTDTEPKLFHVMCAC